MAKVCRLTPRTAARGDVSEATTEISGIGDGQAPHEYVVPAAQSFDLLGVRATFDGAGAAGDFLPALQIISDAGHILSQTVGSVVAAGGSADVTFAPFLRGTATATASGGIKYDTEPQTGTYLYVQTTGTDPVFGYANVWDDVNQSGSLYTGPLLMDDQSGTADTWSVSPGQGFKYHLNAGGTSFTVRGHHTILALTDVAGTSKISFFSVPFAAQQATPVTLADVIALLQAYGLSA
jgi:hypothetical protein